MNEFFRRVAHGASRTMGSPWAFLIALGIVATWAATGYIFDFSNTWQLVINTGTTIVTFLMVVPHPEPRRTATHTQRI